MFIQKKALLSLLVYRHSWNNIKYSINNVLFHFLTVQEVGRTFFEMIFVCEKRVGTPWLKENPFTTLEILLFLIDTAGKSCENLSLILDNPHGNFNLVSVGTLEKLPPGDVRAACMVKKWNNLI